MDIWMKGSEVAVAQKQYNIPEGKWVHVVCVKGEVYIDGAIAVGIPMGGE